ncbi:hypothetical protein HOLleu_01966 [Holothuria leucospilota]|uniref:NACHT domain-containing protein n=1 Tax=Holothuria leucospilota TaxID=206669 RepID=A0A9Q1CRJ0_HOLLE|nr:hypothetical protein HOLleu_01966 [Holothuria leucospilota]
MQTEPKKAFTSVENANDSNFLTDGGDNNVSTKQVDEKAMGEKRSNEVQMPTSALDSKKPEVEIVSKENTNAAPSTMNVTNTDEVDNSGYIEHKLLIEPVIQGLNVRPGIESQGIWENVGSVSDVLTDPKIASKCFIVEGEFGYEMSTISKLLAREWSMEEESELAKCFKVLVVLKCNQISGDQPIYAEIRRLLSITDAALAENDIQGVLCDEHNKVALVLDGLNMYTGAETKINDSLKRIITRQSLKECSVIIITSTPCALNDLKDFTRLRALNLTEKDQESLIRKEIVCRNADTEEQIRTLVKENVLLKDILRIPFFFLFFLRRACVLTYLPKFDSVTSFFMWIISELSRQCPLQHREYSTDMWKDEAVAELGKLAFEALTSKHKWGKNWSKSELLTRLNEDAYKFYQQIGIIREEMLPTRDLSSAKLKNGSANLEARTRFTHSLFYEWYAAQHLKTMFKSQDSHYMKGILNMLSTTDCWYCIRFFCGIDDEHSREVCETVKHKALQLLCKIESEEGLTNIQDVKKFWPKQMSLSVGDSRVQQLATVQLLEVGSKKEFQTLNLKLENCFNSVKDGSSLLELKSGVQLPALANLKQLDVSEDDRELTNEETTGILKFALKSTKLKDVSSMDSSPRFFRYILSGLENMHLEGTKRRKSGRLRVQEFGDRIPG